MAGATWAYNVARWDGRTWNALGTGLGNGVYALTVYNDLLVAGTRGTQYAYHLQTWDGTSWGTFGMGLNDNVYALAVYNQTLIAGGFFTQAGDVPVHRIARWDGSAWSALGAGMTESGVSALAVLDSVLYAAGGFTLAGDQQAVFVGAWTEPQVTAIGEERSRAPSRAGSYFTSALPNLFRSAITLTYTLTRGGAINLEILDVRGARIATLARGVHPAGTYSTVWAGQDDAKRSVPAGVYYVRLAANGSLSTARIVRVR
jgi:hypothetical protein